ncbi:MAG: hypothetical protein Q7K42_04600, partial [Candidatus Diapherotrites archaeon]|nr:hypothetical protein [Candidatus Diapherotrites archaeon]
MAEDGFYKKLEDKFFNFLYWLEDRHVPLIKVADALEDNNIPAFPVTAIFTLIILAVIGMFIAPMVFQQQATLSITVLGENQEPLNDVKVNLSINGGVPKELVTVNGLVKLDVPLGASILLNIDHPEFGKKTEQFIADATNLQKSIVLFGANKTLSKTIRLQDVKDGSVFLGKVNATFSCTQNSDFVKSETVIGGEVTLSDIPSNCGNLTVSVDKFKLENNFIDLEEADSGTLKLSAPITETGSVFVEVKDDSENPLETIMVRLSVEGSNVLYDRKITNGSGSVLFEEVPVDKYYITVSDDSGIYENYDGSGNAKEVLKDTRTSFSSELKKGVKGKIKLKIIDSVSKLPVANIKVNLSKPGASGKITTGEPKYSDAEGKIEFSVPDAAEYTAEFDHPNYIILSKTGVKKTETDEFELVEVTEATEANKRSLIVSILDENKKPVQGAKAVLQKEDKSTVGSEKFTPDSGQVVFDNLQEGKYFVYVVKAGFGEAISALVEVKERKVNQTNVTLVIGTGTMEVNVLNSEGQNVSGAIVSVYDYYTDEKIDKEKLTNEQGKTSFTLRADKKVYIVVNSANSLNYTTVPIQIGKNVTVKKEINLVDSASGLDVKFLGLTFKSPDGEQTVEGTLQPGQKYTGRFLVTTPKNSSFDELGLHVRTGSEKENETNVLEADAWFLKDVSVSQARIVRGISYSPSIGYAT